MNIKFLYFNYILFILLSKDFIHIFSIFIIIKLYLFFDIIFTIIFINNINKNIKE